MVFGVAFHGKKFSGSRKKEIISLDEVELKIMGQKAGALFINPKRFGSLHKPCMQEMIAFLSCMAANTSNSEACVQQKELLKACMESKSKKNRKSWGSINYQLQRLSRGRK
ncbi:hypothetical protein RJT34_03949 [Clitoria ternatea]|uniref:IMS import disulfide relay-system CHCH-CHCH-like Cx9C domain-containing protein n=1 Tax=Clitoria ternatea TaxID=43366 RepID=A0AAN9KLN5_CLITE